MLEDLVMQPAVVQAHAGQRLAGAEPARAAATHLEARLLRRARARHAHPRAPRRHPVAAVA